MLNIIEALQSTDKEAPSRFAEHTAKCIKHAVGNFALSLTRGTASLVSTAMRSSRAYKDGDKLVSYHEAQLLRLSANFAYAGNLCFLLGGRLKFEELLMGRLADAYGAIFLGYATLHHYQKNRHLVKGLEPLVESAMLQLEVEAQTLTLTLTLTLALTLTLTRSRRRPPSVKPLPTSRSPSARWVAGSCRSAWRRWASSSARTRCRATS